MPQRQLSRLVWSKKHFMLNWSARLTLLLGAQLMHRPRLLVLYKRGANANGISETHSASGKKGQSKSLNTQTEIYDNSSN